MIVNPGSFILGSHAYFVRENDAFTVPSAGNAGRNAKPGATDTSWIDVGIIKDAGIASTHEKREIFAPTPGKLSRYDVINTKRKTDIKLTLMEMPLLIWELLFGSAKLAAGANIQFNPDVVHQVRGWLKSQMYGQSDAQTFTIDTWVNLTVSGEVKFSDQIVEAPILAEVLWSTLNTGNLN